MDIVKMIAGPIIGAIIGYGTNYIAVKMLFRPLRQLRIGKFIVPFTPGIIPKRKDKLGHALGEAVGNNLLTKTDLEKVLLSDSMKKTIVDEILNKANDVSLVEKINQSEEKSIQGLLTHYVGTEQFEKGTEKVKQLICNKIQNGLEQLDIGTVIATEAGKAIKQKAQGTMLGFMVGEQLINSIAQPIGESVNEYISNNGYELFLPVVSTEVDNTMNKTPEEVLADVGLSEDNLRTGIEAIYTNFISGKAENIISQFDIKGIVEKKVNEMDVMDIEKLVLSVMENELNAIVNLGAIIGFVLGLFMLLFN